MGKSPASYLIKSSILLGFLLPFPGQAQIVPDNTLPDNTVVTPQGDVIQIDGGTTRGSNLFHSFQEFSVPNGGEAYFNNADTIDNILSRVTGGKISNIDGLIKANGTANLFLINPAGIIFGKGASLDVRGSFIGSSADSLLFPDGIEYSASNPQTSPILTINAPIGLGFRDNPGTITNRSFNGLEVLDDQTLALIGGEVFIDRGFLFTPGGRIEIGSVAENNTASLTEVEQGWDIGYEGVENFRDISLTSGAMLRSSGENTGDVQVQGRNISLDEGSRIDIKTESGQAGNLEIIASNSIQLEQTASDKVNTLILNQVSDDATGEESKLKVETNRLEIRGGQIGTLTLGKGRGVNLEIKASEIDLTTTTKTNEANTLIFAQVNIVGSGDGGNLTIDTEKLTVDRGAQISTVTFGSGDAGSLLINATESVELIGTVPNSNNPSSLFANVGNAVTATGNGGDLTINTSKIMVTDGAQIATTGRNKGNGGNLTLNVSDSILLTGTSPLAQFPGTGRSSILVNVQPPFKAKSGSIIPTTGNGGELNLTTRELIIEKGATISAGTFSVGDGGNAKINVNKLILRDGGRISAGSLLGSERLDKAKGTGGMLDISAIESVEITGILTGIKDINGEPLNSSLFTLAESDGNAGNITLTTNKLNISNGGNINASATGIGSAGNLTINANSLDLNQGKLTAATAAGTGGNIKLEIDDNITLSNNSRISAEATGFANGGNIDIDTTFIIASPKGNSDIIASAGQDGTGGKITIDAEGVFGIRERTPSDRTNDTNDLDASGGVDGEVIINTPDVDLTSGLVKLPQNLVEPEQTVVQACQSDRISGKTSSFKIKGQGGLPASPNQLPDSDFTPASWVAPAPIQDKEPEVEIDAKNAKEATETVNLDDIIPAQGVIVDQQGKIILVGYVPTANETKRSRQNLFNCLKQRHEIDK